MAGLSFLKEIWDFARYRKKWWLMPVILFLMLIAGLIILVSSSQVAPLLYPLF